MSETLDRAADVLCKPSHADARDINGTGRHLIQPPEPVALHVYAIHIASDDTYCYSNPSIDMQACERAVDLAEDTHAVVQVHKTDDVTGREARRRGMHL